MQNQAKILQKISLVVSTNSSGWVTFFRSLCYTASSEKRNPVVKKGRTNLQRNASKK